MSTENIGRPADKPFVKQHWLRCDYVRRQYSRKRIRWIACFPSSRYRQGSDLRSGTSARSKVSPACRRYDGADLELISKGQCFPRYRYEQPTPGQGELPGMCEAGAHRKHHGHGPPRLPRALQRQHDYQGRDLSITSTASFMHPAIASASRTIYRRSCRVSRWLPIFSPSPRLGGHSPNSISVTRQAKNIRWRSYSRSLVSRDRSTTESEGRRCGSLMAIEAFSSSTSISASRRIPAEAHEYDVAGRTRLEWFIDRYRLTQDKASGYRQRSQRLVRRSERPDRGYSPDCVCQLGDGLHRQGLAGAVPSCGRLANLLIVRRLARLSYPVPTRSARPPSVSPAIHPQALGADTTSSTGARTPPPVPAPITETDRPAVV